VRVSAAASAHRRFWHKSGPDGIVCSLSAFRAKLARREPRDHVENDPMYGPAVRCKRTFIELAECAVLRHCIRPLIGASCAPCQLLLLAGPEHGRTIPLPVIGPIEIQQRSSAAGHGCATPCGWKSTSRAIECRRPTAIIRQRSGCGAAGLGEHRTEPFKNADPIAARPLRKFYSRLVSQAELAAHSAWIEQNRHALKIE
jgi:hypothetical protein